MFVCVCVRARAHKLAHTREPRSRAWKVARPRESDTREEKGRQREEEREREREREGERCKRARLSTDIIYCSPPCQADFRTESRAERAATRAAG